MSTHDGTVNAGGAPTWQPEQVLSFRSKKALSITTCAGNTHFTHGGDDNPNEIWWTYRVGNEWLDDVRVPNQASSGGATLGCANGVPYMIHNGTDDQLWYSEFR
jgi:hypothetical protein